MSFRVACAQFAPSKGDLDANLGRIADLTIQASKENADLACFAETAASGYFLEGGVLENALSSDELCSRLGVLCAGNTARPIDALVGFYEIAEGQVYNAMAYLEDIGGNPRVVHVARKFFLATYGVFDEERFMARGRKLGAFNTRFGRFGILICEDVWHSVMPMLLALDGAHVIFNPSASPARGFSGETIGNLDRYHRMLQALSEEHGVFGVNIQLTGFEGGKGFVGGSLVVDPFGKTIGQGPINEDHLLVTDLDFDLIEVARQATPLLADLRSNWEDIRRHLP